MNLLTVPTKSLLRYTLLFGLVSALVAGLMFIYVIRYLQAPIVAITEPVVFEVAAGSSLSRIARDLEVAGYLEHPRFFTLLGRWRGVDSSIKTGEYELSIGISPEQLLGVLVQGNTRQYRITLVEGWTFSQALAAIRSGERISHELTGIEPEQIAKLLGLDISNPEGMLFPDTYFYDSGTSDLQLLKRAHARLSEVLSAAWEERLGALPLSTAYEALILASIIEKESAFGAERGHIAGVFGRRLELGMRLQSDPTVIYGLGEEYAGNLTRAHLEQLTPYNTYRIPALPPTPIALAGLDSITASMHPLPSDFLYFVAKGNGEHQFSNTLAEHNAAVRLYQSAPAPDQSR